MANQRKYRRRFKAAATPELGRKNKQTNENNNIEIPTVKMKYISKFLNHINDLNVTLGTLKLLFLFRCLLLRLYNVYLGRAE